MDELYWIIQYKIDNIILYMYNDIGCCKCIVII